MSERTLTITLQPDWKTARRQAGWRVERDVKRVHEDVQKLLEPGLIEPGEGDGVVRPFDTVHIDMELRAAA